MQFQKVLDREASIAEVSKGYYVLKMGPNEVGGRNMQSLMRYARKQGYIVRQVERWKPALRAGVFDPVYG